MSVKLLTLVSYKNLIEIRKNFKIIISILLYLINLKCINNYLFVNLILYYCIEFVKNTLNKFLIHFYVKLKKHSIQFDLLLKDIFLLKIKYSIKIALPKYKEKHLNVKKHTKRIK